MADIKIKTRKELADVIAAWMRGDISTLEFRKATDDISTMEDVELQSIADEMRYRYMPSADKPISVSRKGWAQLCRWLEFLRTDYHLEEQWPPLSKIPFFVPLVLLLILLASYGMSTRFFASAWFLIAVAWVVLVYIRDHKNIAAFRYNDDFKKREEFMPFLSEEDWLANKHLLDEFDIPQYSEPADKPVPDCRYPETDGLYIALVLLFLPVVLLFECFSRQKFHHFCAYLRSDKNEPQPA